MLENKKIMFLGCGELARAMIKGIINKGLINANSLYACTKTKESAYKLKKHLNIEVVNVSEVSLDKVGIIVLAVKPNQFKKAILDSKIEKFNGIIISVMAAIDIDEISSCFSNNDNIVRVMLNLACEWNYGCLSAYKNGNSLSLEGKNLTYLNKVLFASLSNKVIWLSSEDHINITTALLGSGLATGLRLYEALVNKAINLGLDSKQASKLTSELFLAINWLSQEESIKINWQNICTPNGTTIVAQDYLDNKKFFEILQESLLKSYDRAKEIKKNLK